MSTTWTRLDLARRHCLIHLFCSLDRLRQWRHIPVPSFSISGRWVNFVQHPSSLPCDVLRSILLRFPLVHQPAIIGGSRQPATGRMSQFRPSHRKLMSFPEVPPPVDVALCLAGASAEVVLDRIARILSDLPDPAHRGSGVPCS